MAPALALILFGLTRTAEPGGFARPDVLLPIVGGLLLLTAFARHSLRSAGTPLIKIRLLHYWPLTSSALLLFLAGLALYGAMLLLPLYFQQLRGASVLATGRQTSPRSAPVARLHPNRAVDL